MLTEFFELLPYEYHTKSNGFVTDIQLFYQMEKQAYLAFCYFDISIYQESLYRILGIKFPENIQKSVKKRQAEFLAGRLVAKIALEKFGHDNHIITIGEHRSPVWPNEVRASISHSDNVAACLACMAGTNRFIGIDIEQWQDKQIAEQIKSSIIAVQEEKALSDTGMLPEHALTLAFSAKESLFKAIYPYVNNYLDFNTSVVKEAKKNLVNLQLNIAEGEAGELTGDELFHCRYFVYQDFVITLIID